jgi:hypothetical protein
MDCEAAMEELRKNGIEEARGSGFQGQGENDSRAALPLTLRRDLAAMGRDQASGDG